MRRIGFAVLAGALVLVATAAGAARRGIDSGRIEIGRGIHRVTLGMTRPQVIAQLGKPLAHNANGYMQYSRRSLFDVYVRRGSPRRVDLVTAAGAGFCLPRGICSFKQGSLRRLLATYGDRVRVELTAEQADEPDYVVRGRIVGKATNTAFSHARGRIGQVFIAFADPAEPVFADPPRSATKKPLPVDAAVTAALRSAYCAQIAGADVCADPVFRGPLQGRQCLSVQLGSQPVCDTYRICHFGLGGVEWAKAAFWHRDTGATGTATWFRLGRSGGWRAYRELIVGRRTASALRC
jgi:hypothetical protein